RYRQMAAPHQVVERGVDLLETQVAGGTEDDQRIRILPFHAYLSLFLVMPAETQTHGRQQLVGILRATARLETRVQRSAQHVRGHADLDCRLYGPASLTGVRDAAAKLLELRAGRKRGGRQIQQ